MDNLFFGVTEEMQLTKQTKVNLHIWYTLMKKVKIIRTQKELAEVMTKVDGSPTSQPFISAILTGTVIVPDYMLEKISKKYYFTPIDYFYSSSHPVLHFQKLIDWLCQKANVTRTQLSKAIQVSVNDIKQYDWTTGPEDWQIVFDFFNQKLKLRLNAKLILDAIVDKKSAFTHVDHEDVKSEHAVRLFELFEELKIKGFVKDMKDFSTQIGYEPQSIYNIKQARADVTKDMAVAILRAFPVNAYWFLLGQGSTKLIISTTT